MPYRTSFRFRTGNKAWQKSSTGDFGTKTDAKKYIKYIERTHPVKGRLYKVKGRRRAQMVEVYPGKRLKKAGIKFLKRK